MWTGTADFAAENAFALSAAEHARLDRIARLASLTLGAPYAAVGRLASPKSNANVVDTSASGIGRRKWRLDALIAPEGRLLGLEALMDAAYDSAEAYCGVGDARDAVGAPLSVAGCPIEYDGVRCGAIVIADAAERRFGAMDLQALRALADLSSDALALERAMLDVADTHRAIEIQKSEFSVCAHLANFGVWAYDVASGDLYWSEEVYGIHNVDPLEPMTVDRAIAFYEPGHRETVREAFDAALDHGRAFDIEEPIRTADGETKWLRAIGEARVEDGKITRVYGCAQDVTEEVQARDDVVLLASRDYLTEVANRASFTNAFETRIKTLDFSIKSLVLFLIDIDHFKNINDSFGHDVGDQVLRDVSMILLRAVREIDEVGRLGGDEFGLIVETTPGTDLGGAIADRIKAFAEATPSLARIGGGVTLSIGYTEVDEPGLNFTTALKNADLALYDAKRAGRNRAERYRPSLGDEYERRERILREVDEALKNGEFRPHYQVKVDLETGGVRGFEALARRYDPQRGVLTPGAFAEALGHLPLATRISETVLNRAAADAGALRREGLEFGRIAVNVTEKQISDPTFPERLADCAMTNGVGVTDFEIEITEAVLLARNADHIRTNLAAFKTAGVSVALDDFGTGYASLTHLRDFPIDQLKIDKSFILDLDQNHESRVITRAVISMAQELEMTVVAEGVESEAIAEILREMGCDVAQGYHYSKPIAFEDVPGLIRGLVAKAA